jgi:RES domain-containing protein
MNAPAPSSGDLLPEPSEVRLWRVHNPHAAHARAPGYDPLDGQGAALYPGRWNQVGTRLLYASPNPSLAVLETLNHVAPSEFGERELLEIDVPDEPIEDATGPAVTGPFYRGEDATTQTFGSRWVLEARTLVLQVPSAAMPVEHNLLVNPAHALFHRVRLVRSVRYSLDPRQTER